MSEDGKGYMTEERRMIRDTAREFTMKEVLPVANRRDGLDDEIPIDLRQKMADMGYFGIMIQEEYGVLGLGYFEYCLVAEQLARGWMSVASLMARGQRGWLPSALPKVQQEKQEKYLQRIVRGEFMGASALSEPDTGSDLAAISCRAVRDGDEWVLTGNKYWCTFADGADYLTIFGRTARAPSCDRDAAAQCIARYRITTWQATTTMVIDFLANPNLGEHDLSSLVSIRGGGAAMPAAVAEKQKLTTGLDFIEGYGMMEAMAGGAVNPPHLPKPQCLGIPTFDVDARLVNPVTLSELPKWESGEIVLHGPQLMRGYWRQPEATQDAFIELDGKRFLRTGDLGRVDCDDYLFMTDRLSARAIIDWTRAQMATYKIPRLVEFVDALPKSGSCKLMWRELQDRQAALDHAGQDAAAYGDGRFFQQGARA